MKLPGIKPHQQMAKAHQQVTDWFKSHNKQTTAMKRNLAAEEYKAEKLIAWVRMFVFNANLAGYTLEYFFIRFDIPYNFWPFIVSALFSIITFIQVHKHPPDPAEPRLWLKFVYITWDMILGSYLAYAIFVNYAYGGLSHMPEADFFPLIYLLVGLMFIVLNIYRLSPAACLYTGFASLISYLVASQMLGYADSWLDYVVRDGKLYNPFMVYLGGIMGVSLFSAFIAYRLQQVVIKSKRQEDLERFLPEVVAENIVRGESDLLNMSGQKKTATLLFSDIRDFTTMSEEENPEELVDFLNAYFNDMIDIIFKYNGTLDKIIGDGIMAIFGAPIADEAAPENAVRTGIDMLRKLKDFNEIRKLQNKTPIKIGIGIHTGEVVMGSIGSSKRMEFTAIGDTVNTAARLEAYSKQTDADIIISAATRELLGDEFQVTKLGPAGLKGKKQSIDIFGIGLT